MRKATFRLIDLGIVRPGGGRRVFPLQFLRMSITQLGVLFVVSSRSGEGILLADNAGATHLVFLMGRVVPARHQKRRSQRHAQVMVRLSAHFLLPCGREVKCALVQNLAVNCGHTFCRSALIHVRVGITAGPFTAPPSFSKAARN